LRLIRVKVRRTFLKRHHRIIIIIGAFIVFLTFVTKDAIRDQLKEETDSLQSAETLYLSWIRNNDLLVSLDDIETRIGNLQESVEKTSIPNATAKNRQTVEFVHRINRVTKGLRSLHTALSPLIDKVPAYRQEYETLDKGLIEMEARQDEVSNEIQKSEDANRTEEEHIALLNRAFKGMGTSDVYSKVNEFPPKLIATFFEKKERKEKLYKNCTWLSYILYTVGWGLALIGRLAGDGMAANE
jgi:hypothetical protein